MVKNLIVILAVAGIFMSCGNSNNSNKNGFTIIQGTFDFPYVTDVKLSKVEYGELEVVATAKISADKKFGFSLSPEKEGFYVIGTDQYTSKLNLVSLYIKKNQIFTVEIDEDGYRSMNLPDKENEILYEWTETIDTLNYYTNFNDNLGDEITYKDFFPFYETFLPTMEAYHDKINSGNAKFDKLMHANVDMYKVKAATDFICVPHKEHPTTADVPKYYQDLVNDQGFQTDIVLGLPNGMGAVGTYLTYSTLHKGKKIERDKYLKWSLESIPNENLKAHYLIGQLRFFQALNKEYQDLVRPYRAFIEKDEYLAKVLLDFELKIGKYGVGTPGYEFTAKDVNGNEVSFSEFKGKYLYIDCWATWCAPCKKEIPFLKELEKDFHGKDIVFMSVSFDKQKVLKKWKKYVKEEALGGVQLIAEAAFDSKMAKEYEINSIPRFLLFDREGNVIDGQAKRPSNPDLKAELEALLNK